MGSKWTSIALVAVVSACALAGGLSRVQADYISLLGRTSSYVIDGETINQPSLVQVKIYINSFDGNTFGYPLQPGETTTSLGYSFADDGFGEASFDSKDLSVLSSNQSNTFVFESASIKLAGKFDPSKPSHHFLQAEDSASFRLTEVDNPNNDASNGYSFFLQFTPVAFGFNEVAVLPLPSSAPLFGSALLALAGVGWSARKRQTQ